MSTKKEEPKVTVTTNYGSKDEKPGEEGARKIDEAIAGTLPTTDPDTMDKAQRKRAIEMLEAAFRDGNLDYVNYCVQVWKYKGEVRFGADGHELSRKERKEINAGH